MVALQTRLLEPIIQFIILMLNLNTSNSRLTGDLVFELNSTF